TIPFTLLNPSNVTVFPGPVTVNGHGSYSTRRATNPGGFLPTVTGTFHWVASYSGDANNNPVSSNAQDEPEVVAPASPAISTMPGGTVEIGRGAKLTDSATLSGGVNPTGTITFTLLNPSNVTVYTDGLTENGNGTYDTSTGPTPGGFHPPAAGTSHGVAS